MTNQRVAPAISCPDCHEVNWIFDPNYQVWRCLSCKLNGKKPIVEPFTSNPNMYTDLEGWFKLRDDEFRALMEENREASLFLDNPDNKDKRADGLIKRAMIARNSTLLQKLGRTLEIGSLIKLIMENGSGEMYVKIPDYDIEIKVKWDGKNGN